MDIIHGRHVRASDMGSPPNVECGGTTPLWMLDDMLRCTSSKIQSGGVPPHSKWVECLQNGGRPRNLQGLYDKTGA
jgi:hypothetical protein